MRLTPLVCAKEKDNTHVIGLLASAMGECEAPDYRVSEYQQLLVSGPATTDTIDDLIPEIELGLQSDVYGLDSDDEIEADDDTGTEGPEESITGVIVDSSKQTNTKKALSGVVSVAPTLVETKHVSNKESTPSDQSTSKNLAVIPEVKLLSGVNTDLPSRSVHDFAREVRIGFEEINRSGKVDSVFICLLTILIDDD